MNQVKFIKAVDIPEDSRVIQIKNGIDCRIFDENVIFTNEGYHFGSIIGGHIRFTMYATKREQVAARQFVRDIQSGKIEIVTSKSVSTF